MFHKVRHIIRVDGLLALVRRSIGYAYRHGVRPCIPGKPVQYAGIPICHEKSGLDRLVPKSWVLSVDRSLATSNAVLCVPATCTALTVGTTCSSTSWRATNARSHASIFERTRPLQCPRSTSFWRRSGSNTRSGYRPTRFCRAGSAICSRAQLRSSAKGKILLSSLPGCARASATSSCTFLAGTSLWTTRTLGVK